MIRSMSVSGLALCLAAPASAGLACLFETECFEGEACQEAALSLELVDGDPVTIVTEFGDFEVQSILNGALFAQGQGMVLLLSSNADGEARASFHLEGPIVTTYLGTCEGES